MVAAVFERCVAVRADRAVNRFVAVLGGGSRGMNLFADGGEQIVLQRLADCRGEHRAGNHLHNAVDTGNECEDLREIHGADIDHEIISEVERCAPEHCKEEQDEEDRVEKRRRQGGQRKGE